MVKVVLDTSVFLAGLLTINPMSASFQVLNMWRSGGFTLVMAPQLLRELVAKLIEKEFPENDILELVQVIAEIALSIPGAYESSKLNDVDATDNMFLAAAYESTADYLVSLDKRSLLPLKHFHGTQILSPDLFVRALMNPDKAEEDQENEPEQETRQETVDRQIQNMIDKYGSTAAD